MVLLAVVEFPKGTLNLLPVLHSAESGSKIRNLISFGIKIAGIESKIYLCTSFQRVA